MRTHGTIANQLEFLNSLKPGKSIKEFKQFAEKYRAEAGRSRNKL